MPSARIPVALLTAAILFSPAFASASPPAAPSTPDMAEVKVIGDAAAPVELVEYLSATCPHCARFALDVFPEFKKRYVDTGKVRVVIHEVLTPPTQVAAAGFLLARCTGPGQYYPTLEAVFRGQKDWAETGDVHTSLLKVAEAKGLNEAQFEACISDPKALKALNDRVVKYTEMDKVDGVPTFFVGAKRAEGEQTMAEMEALVADDLAAKAH